MKKITVLAFIMTCLFVQAQEIDATFNPGYDTSYKQYIGEQSASLPSGKFLSVYYLPNPENEDMANSTSIIRLNNDGKIDNTFTPVAISAPSNFPVKIYIKPDGSFLTAAGDNAIELRKFNPDGSLDNSFTSPMFVTDAANGFDGFRINAVLLLADGKVLVGGEFSTVDTQAKRGIIKLNADGSIDTTFLSGTGTNGPVSSITQQADGKFMVTGNFTSYNGTAKRHILRINADGTVDNAFDVVSNSNMFGWANGFQDPIRNIVLQPDGKMLVLGSVHTTNNDTPNRLVRLNANGTKDNSFFSLVQPISVSAGILRDNGNFLLMYYTGTVIGITSAGAVDSSYTTTMGGGITDTSFYSKDGKIIVNSDGKRTDGVSRLGVYRLNMDGSLDLTFNPGSGFNSAYYEKNYAGTTYNYTFGSKVLRDGRILVMGGNFSSYNDVGVKNITRLTPDGILDPGFNLSSNVTYYQLQPQLYLDENQIQQRYDGKLFFRDLLAVNGTPYYRNFVCTNEDGSLDTTFNFNNNEDYSLVRIFKIQPDGKILVTGVSGIFSQSNGYKLLRLNLNGSIDTSFNCTQISTVTPFTSIELQTDGKILVTRPKNISSSLAPTILRLNADGSVDTSFQNTNPIYETFESKVQPDGKILVNYDNSFDFNHTIKRLNADGTVDAAFTPITNGFYKIATVFENGNILLRTRSSSAPSSISLFDANGAPLSSYADQYGGVAIQDCGSLLFTTRSENIDNSSINYFLRYNFTGANLVHAPTGSTYQSFSSGQTLADLQVTGENIQWYSTQSSCMSYLMRTSQNQNTDSLLPPNTPLISGTTYYASQTVNGVESDYRLPVTASLTLGTDDFIFANFSMLPNPAQDVLYISNITNFDKVEIYDISGKMIASESCNSNTLEVAISQYNSGLYFVRIHCNGAAKTFKIIKE